MGFALRAAAEAAARARVIGEGITPSWRIRPTSSRLIQPSASLPSSMRYQTVAVIFTSLPVGGMPNRSPLCVPVDVQRQATLSSSATIWSTVTQTSGNAERNMTFSILKPSRPGSRPGSAWWSTKSSA